MRAERTAGREQMALPHNIIERLGRSRSASGEAIVPFPLSVSAKMPAESAELRSGLFVQSSELLKMSCAYSYSG